MNKYMKHISILKVVKTNKTLTKKNGFTTLAGASAKWLTPRMEKVSSSHLWRKQIVLKVRPLPSMALVTSALLAPYAYITLFYTINNTTVLLIISFKLSNISAIRLISSSMVLD